MGFSFTLSSPFAVLVFQSKRGKSLWHGPEPFTKKERCFQNKPDTLLGRALGVYADDRRMPDVYAGREAPH